MNTNKKNNYAVFFLNTGRCGSQFFATKLAQYYSDVARVEHEVAHQDYQPRRYFAALHRGEKVDISPLQKHFRSIEETLETKHYIETGWPAYGILPYLTERLKGRVKIVHLFRHPVKVAASLTTHNVYSRGEWSNVMSLQPADYGVAQSYLAGAQWDSMSEFLKCLFWWTEINNFALEFHTGSAGIPWFPLRFEDVFSEQGNSTLGKLIDFLEIPKRASFLGSPQEKVDQHSHKTNNVIDLKHVTRYHETMKVMGALGYALDDVMEQDIKNRYQNPISRTVADRIKNLTNRIGRRFIGRS